MAKSISDWITELVFLYEQSRARVALDGEELKEEVAWKYSRPPNPRGD